jgi:hypothetical protein
LSDAGVLFELTVHAEGFAFHHDPFGIVFYRSVWASAIKSIVAFFEIRNKDHRNPDHAL